MKGRAGCAVFLLLILFLVYFAVPSDTNACSPRARLEPNRAETSSEVVFDGTIISISSDPLNILSPYRGAKSLLFEVSSTWKGIDQSQAIVQAWDSSCGYQFVTFTAGDRYVVYVDLDERTGMLVDQLLLPHYKAEEYLASLGQGTSPTRQVSLQQPLTVTSVILTSCFIAPLLVIGTFIFIRRTQSNRPS
jgi:hypothetical protein